MKSETGSANPIGSLLYFKAQNSWRFLLWTAVTLSLSVASQAYSATFVKADNATALNVSGSWVTTGVPGSADTAVWDNTFSAANNSAAIGGSMTWAGILFSNNLQSPFTVNATGSGALTIGTSGINLGSANNGLTLNCPVIEGGVETWSVNAGQSLTFNGPVNGGTATANSTFNLTTTGSGTINFNGNYSDAGPLGQGQAILINSNTVNINPSATGSFTTWKKVVIGNIAGSTTVMNIQSGTNAFVQTNYMVMSDNATATSILNISGGQTLINTVSSPFAVALKGTGVVNVVNAVLSIGANCPVTFGSYTVNGFTGADGTLNINSGGTVIVTNSAQYFALGNGGPSSYGNGHLNLNSGGMLVSGRNIIKNNTSSKAFVTFNGGTLKAATNTAAFMQGLTAATISANGGIIDDGGFAVTIAQPLLHDTNLATDGGLIKQGAGTLTLSGTNTYNGGTTVNAGALVIPKAAGGAPGGYTLAAGAKLIVQAGVAGSTLGMDSLTLNSGSALTLDETTLSVPLITVANALTPSSVVTVNLTNITINPGQYPLIKYGTLGGVGVSGFALGSTPFAVGVALSLVNNPANQSIDLLVATTSNLTWNGTINGAWDISGTANWQGNAVYSETGGVGPVVNFDDTASGTTAIALNTTVSPAGIVINNSSLAYKISGSGQISGNGPLIKNGTGTFTLSTANTFTNLTSIANGTLQLGDGSANNGSVGGSIINNAALVVANPNPQSLNNLISGTGSLTKSGAGTLTLTSSNTLSGSVSVNAGTLALNQGGIAGSVPVLGLVSNVNVASGADLTLAGSNALGTTNKPTIIIAGGGTLSAADSGSHTIGSLALGDFSGGGTLNGPGGLVVNGNFTNFADATVSLGNLVVGGTNILLANGAALTIASNLSLQAASVTTQELISGDPNSGPGTLTTKGNISVNHGVELEYMTWNFDLGTNVMNMTGKLTIGKIPGLPVSVEWISGTGLWAANDYFAMADSLANNPGSIGELDVTGGNLTISNTTYRCLIGNAGTGTINVSGGSLSFTGPASIQLGGDISFPQTGASGTLTISDSGSVTIGPASAGLSLAANNGVASGITGTINLNGGTLTTWPRIANGTNNANGQSYINFNGGTLKAGTNNASFLQGLTQATVQSGGAIIDDGGHVIVIGQSLTDGGGGLTKLGSGKLILTNTSTYSGATVVSNGTLEVDGGLSSPVTVASGGALGGSGTLGAGVTINTGGTLAPGTNAPGILTINGNLELDGSLQIAVNKTMALSNSMVVVSGSLVNGGTGTVTITNAGPALVVGDSFQLFNSPMANGAALTIAGGGAGVVWTNKLALDGSVQVLSVAAPINPLPGVVQFSVSGNTLNLFWPTNAGWILQTQTNALSTGLGTNWLAVPGSTSVTNLNVIINPTNGAVFYRMMHP